MPQQHRFFLSLGGLRELIDNGSASLPQEVTFSAEDAHHIRDVLRLQVGDPLTIVDSNCGCVYSAKLSSTDKSVSAQLLEYQEHNDRTNIVETLVFGLSKGKRNDIVCEKATELGVRNIILWQSEHSIVQIEKSNRDKKLSRWKKIVLSAAKQSQRDTLPQVFLATSFNELLELLNELSTPQTRRLCGSLRDGAIPLPQSNQEHGPIQFVIGPEGDLSHQEQDLLQNQGFELVSLGPFTLRSETAAIVSIAMAEALWGPLNEMPRV